jgi:phosphoglycerol transferase MdoB-like AlkP superfamily enzyme
MNNPGSSESPAAWTRSRYGFAGFWFLSTLAGWLALRLVLLALFAPRPLGLSKLLLVLGSGLQRDLMAGAVLLIPWLVILLIIPASGLRSQLARGAFWTVCFIAWFANIFLLFVEYYFFEEFKSRYNTVAVDYLMFPQEVFVNIWESYHVGLVLLICLVLTAAWFWLARRWFAGLWQRPYAARFRWVHLLGALLLAGALIPLTSLRAAHIGEDRTLNEIANNGALSFVAAFWTRNLDYKAFYRTLPPEEAYARTRRLLSAPGAKLAADALSTRRQIAGDPGKPRLNVVLFLEESLGSEFWGCLGRSKTLTPEMDRLATEEGLLFTNLYASGNRTVRGFEGVLSSFPPLPGDSIVKRDLSDNVETIARVLKRDGYATLFLYGGRGLFDGMRSFAMRNGYDRFVEQKHFARPTFTTIWGVCDEDLFDRARAECRDLNAAGKPFLATILSVSNHKPFTYPKGRIPENPDAQKRENAVKYSDYCLGKFFREARREAFWTNTVFVVVADHGARVYGKQSIPIHSYEIPLVIAGPAVVKTPGRVAQLGGSLDVAPTVLGLLGRPYESLFFGRDLLQQPNVQGRAVLNHNRDIGMLAQDRMAVLGLLKTLEFYQGDPKKTEMSPLKEPSAADLELARDTMALFQVADELYMHRQYRIDP